MRRHLGRWLAGVLLLALVSYALRETWLPSIGTFLLITQSAQRSEAVVVLAGDYTGERVLAGARLVRDGYAPLVLVSGPVELYGNNEADLAIGLAVRSGFPAAWFQQVVSESDSTREEALHFRERLRKTGIRKILLVTSEFHSRRAARIYRSLIPEVETRVIATKTRDLELRQWWTTRSGRKVVFTEWQKTVADWMGI